MSSPRLKVKLLAGGIILNMVAGNLNNWGTLLPYVASYFHLIDSSITPADFSIVTFYAYIAESLTTVLISYLVKLISLHTILCIFCTLFSVIIFLSSYITNPYLFSIIFGISLGALSSCIFLPSLWILWNWIPENKPITSGILLTGYNIGPVFFSLMFTLMVNPDDQKANKDDSMFDKSVANKVPMALQAFSLGLLIGSWAGILLLPRKTRVSDNQIQQHEGQSLKNLLKNLRFWNLFFMMTLAITCQGYIQTLYKVIALNFINDDYFTTYVGMWFFLAGAVGRIAFGYLLNNYHWKKIMGMVYFIQTVLMLGLWFALTDRSVFAFFVVLYGFTVASLYNNAMLLTEKEFPGDKKAISFVCLSFIISFFMPFFLEKFIQPLIGYFLTFVIVSGFSFVLFLQVIFYKDIRNDQLLD